MRAEPASNPARRTSKNHRLEPRSSLKSPNVASNQATGLYDSASVQDRIRQWQAQGAANAPAPDAVSLRSIPTSECASTVSRPKSEYGDENGERPGGRATEKETDEQYQARSSSTPRKRVISDGHWRTKKEVEKQSHSKPLPRACPESTRYDLSYTSNQEKRQGRQQSERHQNIELDREETTKLRSDNRARVAPVVSDEPVHAPEDQPPPYEVESHVDDALARHWTTESVISGDVDRNSDSSIQPEDNRGSNRKRSKYAEMLGRTTAAPRQGDLPRSKKGRLFGKTRDMFMKSETAPAANNRIPSIEAWLDEQPDPLVDDVAQDELPPVEMPRPLRKRTHRKRSSAETSHLTDPNNIWASIQPHKESNFQECAGHNEPAKGEGMNTPDSDHDSTPKVRKSRRDGQNDPDGSPSGLHRRGARIRRQRESLPKNPVAHPEWPNLSDVLAQEPLDGNSEVKTVASPQRQSPPPGTHRLSTIAFAETFKENGPIVSSHETTPKENHGLKRRFTTHEDLMSNLSLPRASKSRRSRRSRRNQPTAEQSNSAREVLEALVTDETRYGGELRTLVDGVIPVLLQCVLSKTDSAAATGLFTSSIAAHDNLSFTKPIIDMGIALERLRTLHNRIPFQNLDNLLNWAQTSQKAYRDYIQAWRLGFQDVIVNLAPLENSTSSAEGMARDELGDLIDAEGKKVDVAYLLKRPLVRVKALSKTFGQIRDQCDKPLAAQMADTYTELTAMAKRRHQEEQARLEDEAAASIDSTRARDIRTMAATAGVTVEQTRRVKARDFFDLTLYHSSGQRMDCGIEMIFRDNARGGPPGGDVLVCEVDDTGKWLLFAPVELTSISARRGEAGFDLVVMIRGRAGFGQEWHELLALKTEDKEAVAEWMNMLGSNPLPPRLDRSPSFVKRPGPSIARSSNEGQSQAQEGKSQTINENPRPENLDVPIGEPSLLGKSSDLSRRSEHTKPLFDKSPPRLNLGGGLASKPIPKYQIPSVITSKRAAPSVVSSDRSTISDRSTKDTTTTSSSSSKTTSPKLGSPSEQRSSVGALRSPPQPLIPESSRRGRNLPIRDAGARDLPTPRRTGNDSREWTGSPISRESHSPKGSMAETQPTAQPQTIPAQSTLKQEMPQRPENFRALSSTPSRELPTVSKLRTQPQLPSPSSCEPVRTSPEAQKPLPESEVKIRRSKRENKSPSRSQIFTEDVPTPPTQSPRQTRPLSASFGSQPFSPAAPPQVNPGVLQPRPNTRPVPELNPTPSPSDKTKKRRTSSPLKHEYAPSTSSDSSSDYDTESVSDSSSDTSEDLGSEAEDMPTPLVAITAGERRASKHSQPPSSMQSTGTRTLAPSDSASQGPYRKVPASNAVPWHKKSKTIALICSWSDRGMWEQVHPDECSIVISPGLIEAFEMSAAHSDPHLSFGTRNSEDGDPQTSSHSQQPLVAFELTPIVPLRRGTALDISIRSPPTANSKIRTTNNIMFRSRNPEECEALYGMINWARCNNPTYIQLQNARPNRQPSVTFAVSQDRHGRSKSSSWFSFGSQKKSSYRASSAPTPASVDMSVESSGTMASAFSVLKKFGASSAFNLNRSSVVRRNGSGGTGGSLYSSSSGTGAGSGSSTPVPSQLGFVPGKDGPNVPSTSAEAASGGGMVNNMKIRLYTRKGQHWENLGSARLTVLPAPTGAADSGPTTPNRTGNLAEPSPPATPAHGRSPSHLSPIGQPGQTRAPGLPSSSHTPHRIHGNGREKRILITKNKDRDIVLLDSVLGESCFERIMQTGVAVKVWNADDVIAETGGVTMGKEKVYMMQFPGTREAGWVFGLCGTYRYGNVSE
ncbi:uncharacterized protein Z518_01965 [Rhinocladiella mackenziei CBS 650.93]|uniref:PI-PLC Y-box domain-containing protein n=1 Tax=Rhinocladiella mackenziei CBS 650.93 TaxID=1442369 RepID=A0A0D2FYC2_9EURO|nr:uncharacterized protein Z518_01965 [Rhinocladiella mackenziei CBS 650.93]KIX07312.1 hypothetical protein Z518_01965 [Rhinocladiella mackenziei CBS 650.93]